MKQKIFDISLPRSRTKSLTMAMGALGFTASHGPDCEEESKDYMRQVMRGTPEQMRIVQEYDFASHMTPFWQRLAREMPDAKFVLTVREILPWLESCANHFGRNGANISAAGKGSYKPGTMYRLLTFGCVEYNRQRLVETYYRHHREVRQTLEADRLLVVTMETGWKPLCQFFDRDDPGLPYPTKQRMVRNIRNPSEAKQWLQKQAARLARNSRDRKSGNETRR